MPVLSLKKPIFIALNNTDQRSAFFEQFAGNFMVKFYVG